MGVTIKAFVLQDLSPGLGTSSPWCGALPGALATIPSALAGCMAGAHFSIREA